jgi:hypothetical protein
LGLLAVSEVDGENLNLITLEVIPVVVSIRFLSFRRGGNGGFIVMLSEGRGDVFAVALNG